MSVRKILHIDQDAFFASVEQRDDPALRGRPVAVGFGAARGVVAAASYEARAFGVHSAMPALTAMHKCPDLVFVRPRFEVYRAISQQIRSIFREYTPLVEPMSLDEAYLDVTDNLKGIALATDIAREIRTRIRDETGLTASAGVSYQKFLAKMASGQRKPDGMFVIPPERGEAFVRALPIGKFHGVGPSTAQKMRSLGIETGADLAERSEEFLRLHFGKAGRHFYLLARGVDERKVDPNQVRKSVGVEDTFLSDLRDPERLRAEIATLAAKLWQRCERAEAMGRTLTLKVKYEDFETVTRSRSGATALSRETEIAEAGETLLNGLLPLVKGIRLLGLTVSNLAGYDAPAEDPQLRLF